MCKHEQVHHKRVQHQNGSWHIRRYCNFCEKLLGYEKGLAERMHPVKMFKLPLDYTAAQRQPILPGF